VTTIERPVWRAHIAARYRSRSDGAPLCGGVVRGVFAGTVILGLLLKFTVVG
jgi:hypothetical protein